MSHVEKRRWRKHLLGAARLFLVIVVFVGGLYVVLSETERFTLPSAELMVSVRLDIPGSRTRLQLGHDEYISWPTHKAPFEVIAHFAPTANINGQSGRSLDGIFAAFLIRKVLLALAFGSVLGLMITAASRGIRWSKRALVVSLFAAAGFVVMLLGAGFLSRIVHNRPCVPADLVQ